MTCMHKCDQVELRGAGAAASFTAKAALNPRWH